MKRVGRMLHGPGNRMALVPADGKDHMGFVGVPASGVSNMPPGASLVDVRQLESGLVEYEEVWKAEPVDHAGPAQVSTASYRRGWEETFNPKELN